MRRMYPGEWVTLTKEQTLYCNSGYLKLRFDVGTPCRIVKVIKSGRCVQYETEVQLNKQVWVRLLAYKSHVKEVWNG